MSNEHDSLTLKPAFKARVAIETISGRKTIQEIVGTQPRCIKHHREFLSSTPDVWFFL